MKFIIVLFKICGNNAEKDTGPKERYKEEKVRFSCKEKFAPYIINPLNKYKMLWDFIMGILYLITFFVDPYISAFLF